MNEPLPSGPQAQIIRFAIRFRGVTVALACMLLAYGVYALRLAKYDVFPEFAQPQVGIQTEAPGLTAEQVEILVTRPIENAVNGVPGVRNLRSTSIQGLSVVTVFFDPSSDIYRDRQVVAERLASAAAQLPQGVKAPSMTPLTSSTSTVLLAGLTSEKRSQMDLRATAQWMVRPGILAVPGVANVAVFGGGEKSVQIQIHPNALARYDLGVDDVLAAARQATGVRGAGFVDTRNQRILFQTEGQSVRASDIARIALVNHGGASVTLANIADVVEAPAPATGGAAIDGTPGVIFAVSQQYGSNTVEVTRAVEAALQELAAPLHAEGITLHRDLFRPATFIHTATDNVRDSLVLGGILVVVVVFLFLFNLRAAVVSCTAIPLSLLTAVIVLERLGVTLNTMTLGGLAISIGVVVDDAVIGVENILRRLRENASLATPRPAARVVLDASLEVRGAIVYATFAVILVVVPVMALSGIAGRLFGPLGLAYTLAVLGSLGTALTVTPALAMMLLARRGAAVREPPVVRWTRARYERMLDGMAGRPRAVTIGAFALTILGCAALPFFGASFIPELKEGHFIVHMSAAPGTSITESLRVGARVTEALRALPVVRSVAQKVGRAELSEDTNGTHYSEFDVDLKPGLSGDVAEAADAEVRQVLAGFVGVNFAVKTFLTERVEETLSGYTAAVAVNIFGNDLDVLDAKANEVARVLGAVPGATEVQLQSPPGLAQVTIRLRPADLQRWGFRPVDVLDVIRTAYQGDVVGQTYEGNRVFNVVAILDRESRVDALKVRDVTLRTPVGTYVRLKDIADIYEKSGRYQVLHRGSRRVQTVTANVAGTDVVSFAQRAKAAVASKIELPPGTLVEFSGAAEARAQSQRDLVVDSLLAAVGIVLLLSIVTGTWRNLLLVLVNLPFALVGGVLAVFATGGTLSLGAMVGFVTLFGISLRNSILMIAHYEHLVVVENAPWNVHTAIRGAGDRLTPILMTSIVTALGVLPLAIGMNEPGREIEGPLAVVILGGLFTSMALNLLVLPTLALRFARFPHKAEEGF